MTSKLLSQPVPAAIQRNPSRRNHGAKLGASARAPCGSACTSTSCGATIAPQRYSSCSGSQRSAEHAPLLRRDSTIPNGQGAYRQHTPQPLQTVPKVALGGALG
nr:hypothetical protein [uncultured Rhodoferax sp.]